jgi:cytochrome bd-type quinol oxidase subunit 1
MDHLKFKPEREIPEICQIIPARWAYEGLMTMQDAYNRFQSKDDALQAVAKNILSVYDVRDEAVKEREAIMAADTSAATVPALQSKLAEITRTIENAQRTINEYEQNKASLDSTVEQHRLLYQDKYGNQEIHRQIMEAQDKLSAILARTDSTTGKPLMDKSSIGLFTYPMLIAEKRIPLTTTSIPTVFYNAVVLVLISILAVIAALGLLALRERLLDAVQRMTKIFQRKS